MGLIRCIVFHKELRHNLFIVHNQYKFFRLECFQYRIDFKVMVVNRLWLVVIQFMLVIIQFMLVVNKSMLVVSRFKLVVNRSKLVVNRFMLMVKQLIILITINIKVNMLVDR